MSAKTHILIPGTKKSACLQEGFTRSTLWREFVTCKLCKKHDLYKSLHNLPKRFRQD